MAPKRKSTGKAEAAEAQAPAAKRKSTGKAAAMAADAAADAAAEPAPVKPAAANKGKAGALAVGDLVPDVELLREDDTSVKLRVSGSGRWGGVWALCRGGRPITCKARLQASCCRAAAWGRLSAAACCCYEAPLLLPLSRLLLRLPEHACCPHAACCAACCTAVPRPATGPVQGARRCHLHVPSC